PARQSLADGLDRGVDAVSLVVAVVVARLAVLPLVAVLDAVFVHQRNDEELDVPAQPLAGRRVSQDFFNDALQDVAGHHLAGVVPAGQGDTVSGLAVGATHKEQLDVPALAGLAERVDLQVRILLEAPEEAFEVVAQVRKGEAEAHLLCVRREGVSEGGTTDGLWAKPLPALAAIAADGRAAHADGVDLGEVEGQAVALRPADAEVPVEPVAGRVAEVLVQVDVVPVDAVQDDVAAGEIAIHADLSLDRPAGGYRGAGKEGGQQDAHDGMPPSDAAAQGSHARIIP